MNAKSFSIKIFTILGNIYLAIVAAIFLWGIGYALFHSGNSQKISLFIVFCVFTLFAVISSFLQKRVAFFNRLTIQSKTPKNKKFATDENKDANWKTGYGIFITSLALCTIVPFSLSSLVNGLNGALFLSLFFSCYSVISNIFTRITGFSFIPLRYSSYTSFVEPGTPTVKTMVINALLTQIVFFALFSIVIAALKP